MFCTLDTEFLTVHCIDETLHSCKSDQKALLRQPADKKPSIHIEKYRLFQQPRTNLSISESHKACPLILLCAQKLVVIVVMSLYQSNGELSTLKLASTLPPKRIIASTNSSSFNSFHTQIQLSQRRIVGLPCYISQKPKIHIPLLLGKGVKIDKLLLKHLGKTEFFF